MNSFCTARGFKRHFEGVLINTAQCTSLCCK